MNNKSYNTSDISIIEYKNNTIISCPMGDNIIEHDHPKIYLPIIYNTLLICPYCNKKYILKEK